MTTQDTITLPREIVEWLACCNLDPRSAPGVDQERYTPKAANAILQRALKPKPDAVEAVAALSSPGTIDQELYIEGLREQNRNLVAQLADRGVALMESRELSASNIARNHDLTRQRNLSCDEASRLRQELNAAKVLCGEAAADIEDRDAELASRAEVIRITKALLQEARFKVDILTAKGIEADVDKLEGELVIAGQVKLAPVASPQVVKLELTIRHEFAATPLTPATTPEQDAAF